MKKFMVGLVLLLMASPNLALAKTKRFKDSSSKNGHSKKGHHKKGKSGKSREEVDGTIKAGDVEFKVKAAD